MKEFLFWLWAVLLSIPNSWFVLFGVGLAVISLFFQLM